MTDGGGRAGIGVGGAFAPFAEALEATLPDPLALSDVAKMTPMEIAQSSELVTSSYRELVGMALSLQNGAYKRIMLDVLRDTRVTFMELYPDRSDREEIRDELARYGYMSEEDDVDELFPSNPEDPQPYLASPQSHEDLYNPHPGGMAITCAVNCRLSEYPPCSTGSTSAYRRTGTWRSPGCASTSTRRPGSTTGRRTAPTG